MNFRQRTNNRFRPSIDLLPSRIAPTVYTPIDPVSMGAGDSTMVQTMASPTPQVMPADADDMVGPSY